MKRTNLYLDERQTSALDRVARMDGISRAEVVRRLIDRSLTGDPSELQSDLAAIEDSFGVFAGEAAGDPAAAASRAADKRAAHLERIRAQ